MWGLEESLVVIIFHFTLKNIKKLIESSLYPRQSTVRGQSFSLWSVRPLSIYPYKSKCKILAFVLAHISEISSFL